MADLDQELVEKVRQNIPRDFGADEALAVVAESFLLGDEEGWRDLLFVEPGCRRGVLEAILAHGIEQGRREAAEHVQAFRLAFSDYLRGPTALKEARVDAAIAALPKPEADRG